MCIELYAVSVRREVSLYAVRERYVNCELCFVIGVQYCSLLFSFSPVLFFESVLKNIANIIITIILDVITRNKENYKGNSFAYLSN